MKISKLLIGGVLALSATLVNANTVFVATDSDINIADSAGGMYAIFDNAIDLAAGTPVLSISEGQVVDVSPAPPAATTSLTNVQTGLSIGITSGNFVFGARETVVDAWILGVGTEKWFAGSNQWDLTFTGSPTLTLTIDIIDITAVPVPAAAWLFGSGLIGLVGIARRRA